MKNIKKTDIIAILALVLPLIVLSGMAINAATHQNIGQEIWRIKITGYDPRDLMYGHFIRFRYDWNIPGDSHSSFPEDQTCLCLEESITGNFAPIAVPMSCDSPINERCDSVIRTYRHGNTFSLNPDGVSEKYFIPEKDSEKVDRLFRNGKETFSIELMAHKDFSVSVRDLYIGDKPLKEYFKALPEDGKK